MKINEKQIEAVISLPGHQRYEYFIKTVVDWESVWGLYQDGWALASTNEVNMRHFAQMKFGQDMPQFQFH